MLSLVGLGLMGGDTEILWSLDALIVRYSDIQIRRYVIWRIGDAMILISDLIAEIAVYCGYMGMKIKPDPSFISSISTLSSAQPLTKVHFSR